MFDATKRFSAFLFLAAVLGACSGNPQAERAGDDETLVMAFETMPGRLDPRFATDAFAARWGLGEVPDRRLARLGLESPNLSAACLFRAMRGIGPA